MIRDADSVDVPSTGEGRSGWSRWYAHRNGWPISDRLFLAEAVLTVGKALCFPWQDEIPQWADLPAAPDIPPAEYAFDPAGRAIAAIHDSFSKPLLGFFSHADFTASQIAFDLTRRAKGWADAPDPAVLPAHDPDQGISPEHWSLASLEAVNLADMRRTAGLAMPAIARCVALLAQSGAIRTFARRIGGGEMVDLHPSVWSMDDPLRRIRECGLDLDQPYEDARATHLIFVERNGFDKAVGAYAEKNGISLIEEGITPAEAGNVNRRELWGALTDKVEQTLREYLTSPTSHRRDRKTLQDVVARAHGAVGTTVFENARNRLRDEFGLTKPGAPRMV